MDNSPFKKLAKELRFMIWEKVVIEPCPIVICSDKICACVGSKGEGYCDQSEQCVTKTQILENLPRTCRVIREECLPIFLKKNQFHFTAITPRRKINRTYHACVNLGVAGRSLYSTKINKMKDVVFDIGLYHAEATDPKDLSYAFHILKYLKEKMITADGTLMVVITVDFLDVGMVEEPIVLDFMLPVGDAAGCGAEIDRVVEECIAANKEMAEAGAANPDWGLGFVAGRKEYEQVGATMKWLVSEM